MDTDNISKNAETKPDGYTVLPAVFLATTRYEARDRMVLGQNFEAPRNLSDYNRSLINAWMELYDYEKSKSRHGYDLYKPVLNGR